MKYLVPLARANKRHCERLVASLGDARVSVRELGALYVAWRRADRAGKERIVAEPLLFLRALASTQPDAAAEPPSLHKDLTALAVIAWRASRRVRDGGRFTAELTKAWCTASEALAALSAAIEEIHAGPEDSTSHPDLA
jgi:hypothetical protein